MAVSTVLATPTTLKIGQQLSIIEGKTQISCWNDSALSDPHYQDMPREPNNPKAVIYWAGLPSKLLTDGDYAVAVSRYESVRMPVNFEFGKAFILRAADDGSKIPSGDGALFVPLKGTDVQNDNGNCVFRKLVWMKASDLILGSYAQQDAMTQSEIDKKNKELADLGKPLVLGNANPAPKNSTAIYVVIFGIFIAFIWGIIALIKKKNKDSNTPKNDNASNVNVIRIPKNS